MRELQERDQRFPASPPDAGEEVAAGRASSVSAWVDQAMEGESRREELAGLLAEMQADNGPATQAEDEWARNVLGLQSSTPGR